MDFNGGIGGLAGGAAAREAGIDVMSW